MGLLLWCPISVWTDLFQRGWKRKKHCPGLTEFLPVFRVLYNNLHDKVQGKGCSHILAIIEMKEASIQFFSSLVGPYHLYHFQFNPFWGRRDFVHLGARAYILKPAYTVCHFTGTFIPESHLPKWLHFTKLVGKKNLDILPPHFSGLDGWNDAFGKEQNSYS